MATKAKNAKVDAAKLLLRAVGKPDNINTVAIDQLACVKAWAAADVATRVAVVDDLTRALAAVCASKAFADIQSSAWNIRHEFTVMVALGKAIDRLIRARLPLSNATLCTLATICVHRADFSALRLTAQLEHHGAPDLELELAIAAMLERFSWDKPLCARLEKLLGPIVDGSAARRDPTERALIAAAAKGERGSREVYADWLETRGALREAAFLRASDPEKSPIASLVAPAWRKRLAG